MIFCLAVIRCFTYYIKLPKQELYLQAPNYISATPYFGKKSTRHKYKIEYAQDSKKDKNFHVDEFPNQVLDVAELSNTLIYYSFYSTRNQQFELQPTDGLSKFKIVFKNRCFTWNGYDKIITLEECLKQGENQIFEFICSDCNSEESRVKGFLIEEETSSLSKGFYSEHVMSSLHAIENMTHELIECFVVNETCRKHMKNHPLLCFSPFDQAPSLSGDWTPLIDKGVDYNVKMGENINSGQVNLDKNTITNILNKDDEECLRDCVSPNDNLHRKNNRNNGIGNSQNQNLDNNIKDMLKQKELTDKEIVSKYTHEVQLLKDAIRRFKDNINDLKTSDLNNLGLNSNKNPGLLESANDETHMLPQHTDIKHHSAVHREYDDQANNMFERKTEQDESLQSADKKSIRDNQSIEGQNSKNSWASTHERFHGRNSDLYNYGSFSKNVNQRLNQSDSKCKDKA